MFPANLQPTVLGAVGTVAGSILFWRGFRDLALKRLLDNTPTARVRSMAMGLVEVTGKVEGRSRVTAPFSGNECVYWQVEIATRGRRNSWNTVHRNSSGNPFFLRDETGVAMVYPKGADCRVRYGVEETCMGLALPDCYATYINEHCGASSMVWRLTSLRFRERVLEEQQQVFVLGSAMPRPMAHTISEGEALAATGTDGAHVQHMRAETNQAAALIRQGENQKVFIISQQSERDISSQLAITGWAKLVGGPLLATFCVYLLLQALR